ncbi:hypothetical protein BDZ89DRAFT_680651 [Hymenopellis radicata]|nr:hypothetical protein BDZ89DRAFT_680651 [Hymenopellis radicata]
MYVLAELVDSAGYWTQPLTSRASSELDGGPAHLHPLLYDAFDSPSYAVAYDSSWLTIRHEDALCQNSSFNLDCGHNSAMFKAGGQLQLYDYDLGIYMNASLDLVDNGTVLDSTLRSHTRSSSTSSTISASSVTRTYHLSSITVLSQPRTFFRLLTLLIDLSSSWKT